MIDNFKRIFLRRDSDRVAFIDGLRAIAVLYVIIFHTWIFQLKSNPNTGIDFVNGPFTRWISRGDLGVDIFFVLSGFLIGKKLLSEFYNRKSIQLSLFYKNRINRIVPAYLFSMILGLYFVNGSGITKVWSNILFINNYVPGSYMPWTWSLAVEEQFYILLPVFILFLAKTKFDILKAMMILIITIVILKIGFVCYVHDFSIPFEGMKFLDKNWSLWFWKYYVYGFLRFDGLFIGVFLAIISLNKGWVSKLDLMKRKIISWVMVFLMFMIASTNFGLNVNATYIKSNNFDLFNNQLYFAIHRTVFSICVAILIKQMEKIEGKQFLIKKILSCRVWYPIALVSYSSYLFHEMFMIWFFPRVNVLLWGNSAGFVPFVFNSIVSLIIILLVAGFIYKKIELPFLEKNRKLKING